MSDVKTLRGLLRDARDTLVAVTDAGHDLRNRIDAALAQPEDAPDRFMKAREALFAAELRLAAAMPNHGVDADGMDQWDRAYDARKRARAAFIEAESAQEGE